MFKNVASQKLTVFAFDATTNLPKTGDAANITAYVNKDDVGANVLTDTSASETDATNAKGYYTFDLAQAETNGTKLVFTAKSSTSNIVVIARPDVTYTEVRATGSSGETLATASQTMAANITEINGDPVIVSSIPGAFASDLLYSNGNNVPAGAIPNAVAGAAGGIFIAGTNAGTIALTRLTVSNGVSIARSASNSNALDITGNGSGAGIVATGGTTGIGIRMIGGGTSGAGLALSNTSGNTLTCSGAATIDALTVTNATTLSGAVSLGSTLGVAGATTMTGRVKMTAGLADGIKHWWVHPTTGIGSDSNDGHSPDKPIKTFTYLATVIQAYDHIHLFPGVPYLNPLLINGGNTLGRDVSGVHVHGNGAVFEQTLGVDSPGYAYVPVAICTPGAIIEDLTARIKASGTYGLNDCGSGTSAIVCGPSGTVRRCLIEGPHGVSARYWGQLEGVYDPLAFGAGEYAGGTTTVEDCVMYVREGAVLPYFTGAATEHQIFQRNKVIFGAWETCESGLLSTVAGKNTITDCYVDHQAGRGDLDGQSNRLIHVEVNTSEITLERCTIINKGRNGQTYSALFGAAVGVGARTITTLNITDCTVKAPTDLEAVTTVTNLRIHNSTFEVYPEGSVGPVWDWDAGIGDVAEAVEGIEGGNPEDFWSYGDRTLTGGERISVDRHQYTHRTIIRGDSYASTSRSFLVTIASGAEWPTDLTSYTLSFASILAIDNDNSGSALSGTVALVTATGSSRSVRVTITASVTALAAIGDHDYAVRATLTGGIVMTLELGVIEVKGSPAVA